MLDAKLSISVAMCTYNGEKFLHEQLQSIAQQTRPPDELVICDDGSTDSTPQIVSNFSRSVSFPVRWIRNAHNLGSTKNFEQAIGLCMGDLIGFCDQDDIWLSEKLERQAEMMEREPALGGVFSDAELVDDKSRPIGKRLWASIGFTPREQRLFRGGGTAPVLLRRNVVTGATLMIRAHTQSLFLPIPAIWVHDGWIAWMLTVHSSLTFMERPLVQYRLHANQQIGVEAFAMSRHLSLRQRLEKGKREEPPKQLACAREMKELERRLAASDQGHVQRIVREIKRKASFQMQRGTPTPSKVMRVAGFLLNARNYNRFDSGMKCLLRDILMEIM